MTAGGRLGARHDPVAKVQAQSVDSLFGVGSARGRVLPVKDFAVHVLSAVRDQVGQLGVEAGGFVGRGHLQKLH